MPCLLVRFFLANLKGNLQTNAMENSSQRTEVRVNNHSFEKEDSIENGDLFRSIDVSLHHRLEYECNPIRSLRIEYVACRR